MQGSNRPAVSGDHGIWTARPRATSGLKTTRASPQISVSHVTPCERAKRNALAVHSPKRFGSRGERGARVHPTKAAQQLVFLHAVALTSLLPLFHACAHLPDPLSSTHV
ncbi:hypothetical protein O3P69_004533 [Scylla paramamosain]|uniref:Uncharacterized protein n=1 Tax=Scylla paramamosain TaxID=85552 RepID=A0AAW0UDM5_SCYPA